MANTRLTAFKQLLHRHRHIGLDTMCFIYQFANHPQYSPLTNSIFEQLNANKIKATTSTISLIESLVLPERHSRPEIVADYTRTFQQLPNLTVITVDTHLALLTAKLRALYPSLRTPDAIQLSSALLNHAKIFITNDKKLTQVKQIKVKLLSEYVD